MYYTILSLVFLLFLSTGEAATPVNSSQGNPPQNHSAFIDSTQAAAIVDESAKDDQHFQDNLARDNPVQDYSVETNSDVDHQTEDQKEGQKEGKFPRLERQHTLGAIQRSWDKAGRQAGVYTVTYSQQQLIRLRLREFMTTTVVLPTFEVIEDIIVGDKSTFEAVKNNDHIVLMRSKEFVGADSNITIVGRSGIVYSFYVRSEGYNSENLPDLRVHVHVPGDVPMSFPAGGGGYLKEKSRPQNNQGTASSSEIMKNNNNSNQQKAGYPQTLPPKLSRLNFKWSMSGDASIAPRQVFSDGVRTWFNFDDGSGRVIEQQDLPIIARVMDGVDTPVNTRIDGTMVIAESEGVFTLRNGTRTVCIYPTDLKMS